MVSITLLYIGDMLVQAAQVHPARLVKLVLSDLKVLLAPLEPRELLEDLEPLVSLDSLVNKVTVVSLDLAVSQEGLVRLVLLVTLDSLVNPVVLVPGDKWASLDHKADQALMEHRVLPDHKAELVIQVSPESVVILVTPVLLDQLDRLVIRECKESQALLELLASKDSQVCMLWFLLTYDHVD